MKTILIVEDEISISAPLQASLTKNNFNILVASNGEGGLDIAIKEKPDLILLDILMPVVNGVEFLEKLREDEWGKKAKVMVISNLLKEDVNANTHIERFNIEDYIIKSEVDIRDIVDKACKILGVNNESN